MTRIPMSTLVALIALFGGIGGGLVFPILPALGLELGIPGFMVGLILSSNRIARLIFNLPAGHLFHILGPRTILSAALLIETGGMLAFSAALASDHPAEWLLVGRFVYGIGMSFLLVGAQAAALGFSDKSNRGRQTASLRVAINSAVPVGLVLGGLLADFYSNNVAFLTGAAFSFASAIFAVLFIPSKKPDPQKQRDDEAKDKSAFGFLALVRSPNLAMLVSACSFNFLIFLTVQGALLSTLVLLVQQRHISIAGLAAEGTSGLVMALMIGFAAVTAFAVGRAIDALPLRSTPLFPSLIGLSVGFVVLALAHSLPLILIGAVLTGLSYNSVTLPMMALLGDAAEERQHGPAVAAFQFFGDIGGTIGPMLGIEMAARIGLTPLYLCMAAIVALAVLVAIWLRLHEKGRAADLDSQI